MADSTTHSKAVQRSGQQLVATFEYVLSVWGILSFGLILCPLLMLLFYSPVNEMLQPIASIRVGGPIALICTFVIAFYVFTLRNELFKYSYTMSFGDKKKLSIPFLALYFFVAAIVLAFILGFGLADKDALVSADGTKGTFKWGGTGHMFLKLMMTGCLVFVFVFLSLSASLMAAYRYSKAMPTSGPNAPLFTKEEELRTRILNAVRGNLGLKEEPAVSDMKRLGDGGISLTLHYRGEEMEQQDIRFREDKILVAEADYRGQLIKIEEKEVRQSKVEAFQVTPVLEAAREVLGIEKDKPLTVSGMKRDPEGEVLLTLVHQGRTWIARADRWSRLISIEGQP